MEYEMKIPAGVPGQILAEIMEKLDVDVKQTDYGPVIIGDKEDLETAQDMILRSLNERIKELEGKK